MLFQRTTAFLLLLVFFAQAFNRYLLVADYYVHTSSYIANCINQDKPWMRCNGRCQLCKKLHQQDDKEDKQTPERKSGNIWNESLFSSPSFSDFSALQLVAPAIRHYPECPAAKPVRMPRCLFHPPCHQLA